MNESLEAEFLKHGCKNRKDAAIATQVYLELCEVKRYWDVKYFYSSSLEKIYFTAKKKKTEEPSFFIPVAVSETVSFTYLQDLLKLSCNVENPTAYIVIVHFDSTSVYYQLTNGLGEPPSAASKHINKNFSQKRDEDLRKNRKLLEQAALYGIPISITKKQNAEESGSSKT